MHCVLEGVVKKMVNMWFTDVGQPYYIKLHMATVNARLMDIKLPNTVTRTPRTIAHANRWKGKL